MMSWRATRCGMAPGLLAATSLALTAARFWHFDWNLRWWSYVLVRPRAVPKRADATVKKIGLVDTKLFLLKRKERGIISYHDNGSTACFAANVHRHERAFVNKF